LNYGGLLRKFDSDFDFVRINPMAAKGLSLITKPQVVEYRKLYE